LRSPPLETNTFWLLMSLDKEHKKKFDGMHFKKCTCMCVKEELMERHTRWVDQDWRITLYYLAIY
jgi:hypothetical protein